MRAYGATSILCESENSLIFRMSGTTKSIYCFCFASRGAGGDGAQAVKNNEKSLLLNPKNTNATDMPKKLRER